MELPQTPSFGLEGRRALVAGGTSGIGLGCAVSLAEAGAQVTVMARRAELVEETVAAINGKGWSALPLVGDVSDIEASAAAVHKNGPYDVLVNAAGAARHGPFTETTAEDYDAVMNLNVRGAYFLAQAAAKGMMAAGKLGSIITISSQMAQVGGVERAVYCASKHAVEGFTKAMAVELGQHKIRVNTICPTFVRTPLTEATLADPKRVEWIEEKIKLGRMGEVEDIMGAVRYLASDASSLVTGTALLVDGGWTAG